MLLCVLLIQKSKFKKNSCYFLYYAWLKSSDGPFKYQDLLKFCILKLKYALDGHLCWDSRQSSTEKSLAAQLWQLRCTYREKSSWRGSLVISVALSCQRFQLLLTMLLITYLFLNYLSRDQFNLLWMVFFIWWCVWILSSIMF